MPSIQTLKDTFYGVLRDRIAAANPSRTIVVRGLIRPSVLVVENELPAPPSTASPPPTPSASAGPASAWT